VGAKRLRVAVVGDFNSWDRRRHPMRVRHQAGIWELFLPRVAPGSIYKYDILGPGGLQLLWKADPVARQTEPPPKTASIVPQPDQHRWHDEAWMGVLTIPTLGKNRLPQWVQSLPMWSRWLSPDRPGTDIEGLSVSSCRLREPIGRLDDLQLYKPSR